MHDYFDHNLDVQEKKHDFKCYQQTVNDVDRVWPGALCASSSDVSSRTSYLGMCQSADMSFILATTSLLRQVLMDLLAEDALASVCEGQCGTLLLRSTAMGWDEMDCWCAVYMGLRRTGNQD